MIHTGSEEGIKPVFKIFKNHFRNHRAQKNRFAKIGTFP